MECVLLVHFISLHIVWKLSAAKLPETACLTLPLEQGQDVALLHGTLDIADDAALLVVDKLNTDLSHVAGAASAAEHPAQNKSHQLPKSRASKAAEHLLQFHTS